VLSAKTVYGHPQRVRRRTRCGLARWRIGWAGSQMPLPGLAADPAVMAPGFRGLPMTSFIPRLQPANEMLGL
jgi:hypothetical protein